MRIYVNDFFDGLNVNRRYFIDQFKKIGVVSRFIYTMDDLMIIKNNLPILRFKSALVVERAVKLLDQYSHVAKV